MEQIPEVVAAMSLFLGLPWMIFHYVTRWKMAKTLTGEDEKMLDELHDIARRLDDRLNSVERIVAADNPNWRAMACEPTATAIQDARDTLRRIK